MGASDWDAERRAAFAENPADLLPTEARVNRSKGARRPPIWLPPDAGARCEHVLHFARVARAHALRLPADEARGSDEPSATVCGRGAFGAPGD